MSRPFVRRICRHTASHETGIAKKDNKQEPSFFGEASQGSFFQPAAVVQRKCETCEEEDKKVHRQPEKKEEDKQLMRAEDKKEEEKVMRAEEKKEEEKPIQKKESGPSVSDGKSAGNYISSLNGRGNPLPAKTNHFFSARMGYDFSNVKIHTDKAAAESAKDLNAKAYSVGDHIVFNEGQFNSDSTEGKKLMAHELTHVIQNNGHQQIIARTLKDDTEKKYTVKITKGDKDWKPDEIQLVANALGRLNKKEKTVVEGYEFIRWSNKAERVKADKTYIPPEGGFEENCLHENNFKTGIYRITAYDSCFGDPEARAGTDNKHGVTSGEFRILHEIGHLMQMAEFRAAFLEYQNIKDDKKKGAKLEEINEVKDKSQQDFDKLTKGKKALPESEPANAEQFAESFAVYKTEPRFLEKRNKALHDWFKNNGHLKRIK